MTPTKPYHVVALHRIDGMVLLGEFDSASERDDLYRRERPRRHSRGDSADVAWSSDRSVEMIPPAALFFGLLATIALLTVYSTRSADAEFAASCPECLT